MKKYQRSSSTALSPEVRSAVRVSPSRGHPPERANQVFCRGQSSSSHRPKYAIRRCIVRLPSNRLFPKILANFSCEINLLKHLLG
ncbi:unnamed protein product, partial [Nesidiocoris tenuis]